jgi:hypothetical protein
MMPINDRGVKLRGRISKLWMFRSWLESERGRLPCVVDGDDSDSLDRLCNLYLRGELDPRLVRRFENWLIDARSILS